MAADLESIRRFYLSNFWAFCKDILGYEDILDKPHFEVCEFIVNSPGDGSCRTSNIAGARLRVKKPNKRPDKKRKLLLLPRNTFKSTLNSKAYPIWRLLKNINEKILIVSFNEPNARNILKEITGKLERPELKAIFGDYTKSRNVQGATWNRNEIQLWDPVADRPVEFDTMPNIKVCGLGTNIVGLHCDTAIVDDTVTPENIGTEEAREQAVEFMRHLEPIVNPGGSIFVIGTRYHYEDLYGWMLQNDEYDIMLRSAINEDDTLYFPERLSREYIDAQFKIMGSYVASCQYFNTPINPTEQVFKEHWIQACTRGYELPAESGANKLNRVLYIDPAFSMGKKSDYTAMVVMAMDHRGQMWVLDCLREKLLDDELVDRVYWLEDRYKPHVIGIEANAGQKLFLKIFQLEGEKRNKRLSLRPVEHSTRRDKDFRIRGLMPFVERAQIKISPVQDSLLTEMRRYTHQSKEHDDQLDALEGAVSLLKPPEYKEEISLEVAKEREHHAEAHDLNYKPGRRKNFSDGFNEVFA